MAKNLYVGVGGKARKMKAAYIGISGKARKIKKIYVGVGGKARLVYQSYIPVTGISLSNVLMGTHGRSGIVQINATIKPSNAQNKALTWTVTSSSSTIRGYFHTRTGDYDYTPLFENKKPFNPISTMGNQVYVNVNMFNRPNETYVTLTITAKSADGVSTSEQIRYIAEGYGEDDRYYADI